MNVGTFVAGVLASIVMAFALVVAYQAGQTRVCEQLTASQQRAIFDCRGQR